MLIAVVSDLHLGAKNALDRFGRRTEAEHLFLSMLDELEHIADMIVLLGDVFETLRGRLPGGQRRELEAALNAYPLLSRRFLEDPRYRLVQGNHDAIGGAVLGVPEFLEIEDGGTKLLFFHGHQLSWFERGNAPLSRVGVWLGGWLERMGMAITHIADRRRSEPQETTPRDFERKALTFGRSRGADVVVTGHTHFANRVEIGDQLALNSGTCVAGRREYLILDTSRHDYHVICRPQR